MDLRAPLPGGVDEDEAKTKCTSLETCSLNSWSLAHLDAGANPTVRQKKGFGVRNKQTSTDFLEVARAAPSQASSCQPGSERELAVKFEEK